MGTARTPAAVKLIAGLLAASAALLDDARARLAQGLGEIDAATEPGRWTLSDYYAGEMGPDLWRQFVSFAGARSPQTLADVKRTTNELEGLWMTPRGRSVNIDPGYLDLDKLVLASTKDAAHRIYLRDGIYAEATLAFAHDSFRPYAYTYRDYAGAVAIDFFNAVRRRWRLERRSRLRTVTGNL